MCFTVPNMIADVTECLRPAHADEVSVDVKQKSVRYAAILLRRNAERFESPGGLRESGATFLPGECDGESNG